MALTERELQTKNNYDANAETWIERSGGRNRPSFWAEELSEFKNFLPRNSRVVEVGSGPATDGKYLEEIGIKTFSFDYSKTMVGIAKELRPVADILQMNTYETGFADNSFDGFVAIATILHLEKPQKALKEICRITKDQGVGFITVKEGDENESGIDPRSGYFFKYFTDEKFKSLLENAGFSILKSAPKKGVTAHDWLTYLVKVNKW